MLLLTKKFNVRSTAGKIEKPMQYSGIDRFITTQYQLVSTILPDLKENVQPHFDPMQRHVSERIAAEKIYHTVFLNSLRQNSIGQKKTHLTDTLISHATLSDLNHLIKVHAVKFLAPWDFRRCRRYIRVSMRAK